MTRSVLLSLAFAATIAMTAAACGGGDDGGPTSPGSGGGGTIAATITIGADGVVSPKDVTVPVGSRVTFVNNHNRSHAIFSDPHPAHGSCPAIDQVGFMSASQSRTSGNLNTAGPCSYHDHDDPDNTNLQGTIRVQ